MLASLFLLGGLNKILNYQATLDQMAAVGLQPTALLLPLTIFLEIAGGIWFLIGKQRAYWAAIALAIFTLSTNLFFHRFWELEGQLAQLELSLFFKNVAIAGALLAFAGSTMGQARSTR